MLILYGVFIRIYVINCSYPEHDKAALERKIKLIITDDGTDKKIVSSYTDRISLRENCKYSTTDTPGYIFDHQH